MKFSDALMKLKEFCVNDFGSRGRCTGCKRYYFIIKKLLIVLLMYNRVLQILRAPQETARVDSMVLCQDCLHSKYPENKTAKLEVTDAKFKCPSGVEKCNADQLSWEEFWVGACCENASRWTENFCKSYEK